MTSSTLQRFETRAGMLPRVPIRGIRGLPGSDHPAFPESIPHIGGDTLWCSMYGVHDALPEGMRARLKDCHAVHDIRAGYQDRLDNG